MIYLLILMIVIPLCGFASDPHAPYHSYLEEAKEIHMNIVTLDSHTDTPLMFGSDNYDISRRGNPTDGGGKIDFPRMKEGGLDAAFFAVFLSQGPGNPQAWAAAKDKALVLFDNVHMAIEQNKNMAGLALTPADALRLKQQGKSAVYIGLENAYPIGEDLSLVNRFYDLGARYITLCHTRNNHFCDSSNDAEGAVHNGLSPMGRELVKKMNQMGMLIDVSHSSDKTFYDVINLTTLPVIASHSNARAVNDDPRNLDDDMLKALARNGGVVQLCFLYVKKMPANPERDAARAALREKFNNFENLTDEDMTLARQEWQNINRNYPVELPTVSDLVDHLDYIVNLIGIDHVGIGSDFDGGGELKDCYDVSQMHNITAELLRRKYSVEDIEKIWSGNFMRVFKANSRL